MKAEMPAELGGWAEAPLARLRDLPRLGQADWAVVAGAHTGRYPRPRGAPSRSGLAEQAGLAEGWWPLLSTCVVRQVVELDEEAGLPSLLRGPFGAWTGGTCRSGPQRQPAFPLSVDSGARRWS